MAGAIVSPSGTKTTIGLDGPISTREGLIGEAHRPQVAVYPSGVVGADVVVDLGYDHKVRPSDGGGYVFQRVTAFPLTRDEALNLIRAIQRSLGIDPDRLVRAMAAVETTEDDESFPPTHESEEALFEAFNELYAAVAEVTGQKVAADR